MSALFVTATGTELGKTFVTCGLARHLRAQGGRVDALKPIASGLDIDHPEGSDSAALLAALGRAVSPENIADISPWRFAAPLSPDMAAAREGRTIDFAALVSFCRDRIARSDRLLIEGIGGLMVPLDDRHTVLDWLVALDVPAVLVTGSYLGSLSHTLTALEVLAARRCRLAALVVSETPGSSVSLDDTLDSLRRFVSGTDVFALPRLAAPNADHPAFGRIATLGFQRIA
jgi:dethiobiotin synthetase